MNPKLMQLQREIDRDFGIYQSKFEDLHRAQEGIAEITKKQDELALLMAYFNKLVDSKRKETMDKVVNLVSFGLQSVFKDNSIKLVVHTRTQRNQKFYTLAVSIGGVETEDFDACSGGVVNVLSFMLRVVMLSISSRRRFLVLDEPFPGLSKEYRDNLGEFLKLLAEKLDMQFLIVSHQPEIDEAADYLYEIKKIDGEVQILPVVQKSNAYG